MYADEDPLSPRGDLLSLGPVDPEWQTILHASNQVVLYNPTSHALSVQRRSPSVTGLIRRVERQGTRRCPFCHRSIPGEGSCDGSDGEMDSDELVEDDLDERTRSRAPNYFQLLQISNETTSMPSTPLTTTPRSGTPVGRENGTEMPFRPTNMAEGYFEAFFQEECRLGMGANGSVYLCRVRMIRYHSATATEVMSARTARTQRKSARSFRGQEDCRGAVIVISLEYLA